MLDIRCCNDTITSIFNWLSSLSWPIFILIIVLLFKNPISRLLENIKTAEFAGIKLQFGDSVPVYSSTDKAIYEVELRPPSLPSDKITETKIPRLSDEEIEQSKQRALKRLEDDTRRVGYSRGKLRQLDNGSYAIAWEVQSSIKIGIKT